VGGGGFRSSARPSRCSFSASADPAIRVKSAGCSPGHRAKRLDAMPSRLASAPGPASPPTRCARAGPGPGAAHSNCGPGARPSRPGRRSWARRDEVVRRLGSPGLTSRLNGRDTNTAAPGWCARMLEHGAPEPYRVAQLEPDPSPGEARGTRRRAPPVAPFQVPIRVHGEPARGDRPESGAEYGPPNMPQPPTGWCRVSE
jgi:hypothetical protein